MSFPLRAGDLYQCISAYTTLRFPFQNFLEIAKHEARIVDDIDDFFGSVWKAARELKAKRVRVYEDDVIFLAQVEYLTFDAPNDVNITSWVVRDFVCCDLGTSADPNPTSNFLKLLSF